VDDARVHALIRQALEPVEALVRQLQYPRIAAGRVIGGGGSTYTLEGSVGVASVAGVATGRCNVVLSSTAGALDRIWPVAAVLDNGAFHCTVTPTGVSPAAFDVYQWDAGGAATNRSFTFVCVHSPV
jgi:hypothetical protein